MVTGGLQPTVAPEIELAWGRRLEEPGTCPFGLALAGRAQPRRAACTAPKLFGCYLTVGLVRSRLPGSAVLVDHSAESVPGRVRRAAQQPESVVGRPLLAGLVRAVAVAVADAPLRASVRSCRSPQISIRSSAVTD